VEAADSLLRHLAAPIAPARETATAHQGRLT
jgi:hypothetical protein